jgi:nitrile hydratase subunit beta
MNGIHDLGGMHGFGPVVREQNEPVFHAPWERTVVGLQQATRMQRLFNIDEFRRGIEQMEPVHYLQASYYERWIESIAANLVEKGFLTTDEIAKRSSELTSKSEPPTRHDNPQLVERLLGRPRSPRQATGEATSTARFKVGDPVVTRNDHPIGHTRIPRYVRGKRGVVDRLQGVQTFPDTNAHGLGAHPQMVYSVRFTGAELWGASTEPGQTLNVDLWEAYLEPAQ